LSIVRAGSDVRPRKEQRRPGSLNGWRPGMDLSIVRAGSEVHRYMVKHTYIWYVFLSGKGIYGEGEREHNDI
jgi:hypothetical protein